MVRLKGKMAWCGGEQSNEPCGRGDSLLEAEDDDACGRRWASGEVSDGGTWCLCKMLKRCLGLLGGQDLFCWVL